MWKEKLPIDCPPPEAKELNVEVYRFLNDTIPNEKDFLPYARLYPKNNRYKSICQAYAISSFDTIDNAKSAWLGAKLRGKIIGKYIGKFVIKEKDGKNIFNSKTGHYSTWLYESEENNTFEFHSYDAINED